MTCAAGGVAADKMGFVSGQEFIVAIEEARKVGADLLLGDRDVKVREGGRESKAGTSRHAGSSS